MNGPALAAAIGGPAVGIAGVFFGWLNARGERDNATALATQQHSHERELARTERLFDNERAAYEGLADLVLLMGTVVERTNPFFGPLPEPPPRPPDEELRAITARANVFGSEAVMNAANKLAGEWNTFIIWADAVSNASVGGAFAQVPEARSNMETARNGFRTATEELFRAIRTELRG